MRYLPLLLLAASLSVQAAAPLPPDVDPKSLSRLPLIPRSSLDAEGQRIFDAINTAVTGKQEEYPRQGPPNSSMYSLAVAEPYDKMNQLLRKTVAGRGYFEICTLLAARDHDQEYEWAAHEPAAKAAGVSAETIDAIRYNRSTAGLPEKDRVLIEFGRQLLRQHRLDTPTYNKMIELFGKQGFVELTMSLGDYVMTAILLNAVNQQVPADRPLNLPIEKK